MFFSCEIVVAEEGLRNHNFIIPRPKQIIKGNIDENVGNRLSCSSSDFLPGACRTVVVEGVFAASLGARIREPR